LLESTEYSNMMVEFIQLVCLLLLYKPHFPYQFPYWKIFLYNKAIAHLYMKLYRRFRCFPVVVLLHSRETFKLHGKLSLLLVTKQLLMKMILTSASLKQLIKNRSLNKDINWSNYRFKLIIPFELDKCFSEQIILVKYLGCRYFHLHPTN
jgi:hypothetical protein